MIKMLTPSLPSDPQIARALFDLEIALAVLFTE